MGQQHIEAAIRFFRLLCQIWASVLLECPEKHCAELMEVQCCHGAEAGKRRWDVEQHGTECDAM